MNGVELEVFEAGRENAGSPIVLCHGWPDLAYTWRFQIPELVAAGYHVIVPNQRGFGRSATPENITDYDIEHLTGDLAALLDHFGYASATFVGHDWGAFVVWSFTLLHPERFINNLYWRDEPLMPPSQGMAMLEIARAEEPPGLPLLSARELAVYESAFRHSEFTGGINWYRNLNRNWHLLADADPIIQQLALMVYGMRDAVARSENLSSFVPNVEELSLDSGHWVQQERHRETTRAILDWLDRHPAG